MIVGYCVVGVVIGLGMIKFCGSLEKGRGYFFVFRDRLLGLEYGF